VNINLKSVNVDLPIFCSGHHRLFKKPKFLNKEIGGSVAMNLGTIWVQALKNLSLEIRQGDRLGLIGHNGAGKSTLLKVIAGIIPCSSGHIEINGKVGTIFGNESNLSNELTGRETIEFYFKIFNSDEKSKSYQEDIISFTELGDYIDLPLRVYSAGMTARLFAALITSVHKDILLIDEGIGAGDLAFQMKFSQRLDKFLTCASILVAASHSFELLKQYCNKGLVLEHGEIRFFGPINEAIEHYTSGLKA